MFRVTQIFRNLFLRLEGLLYQFFGFIKKLFNQVFAFFTKLFGFSQSEYYLESDEAQGIKGNYIKQPTATEPEISSPARVSNRRRPDPKMEYYRNLARQVTKN
ncbi:MAG: threonine dehydratase [Hassallia sp.]